jgi:internalin A
VRKRRRDFINGLLGCGNRRVLPRASSLAPRAAWRRGSAGRDGDLKPLSALVSLQTINCSVTKVSDLAPLAAFTSLQSIDCSFTQVHDLAPLAALAGLQSINCWSTRVRDLSPLASLANLQKISCSYTRVSDLSPLAGLASLRSIDCRDTTVSDLEPLSALSALESINCSVTRVTNLAPLARIGSLRSIIGHYLTLDEASAACFGLLRLKEFGCVRTRIRGVPPELLQRTEYDDCLPRLRAHLQDLVEGAVESRDAKLMALGNGRVGKTQLGRRLRNLPFEPEAPSTHGIVVDSFSLPSGDDPDFARINLWDFGGQDIYHGTHALFLRANAVFLLVWAPEFESGEQTMDGLTFRNFPLRYWVDYVRQLGGADSAVIIVQTRCDRSNDRRPCPIGDDDLKWAFGNHEVLQFSALKDHGLPALKEKIGEAIAFLRERQGAVRIGASRARVKQRIERLRDEDRLLPTERKLHRWITQEAFRRICEEERLVSDPQYMLDYLHNTGVVFHRKGMFDERIVLDRAWALEAIYAVFRRDDSLRQLRGLRGRFSRPLLEALVWRDRPIGEQKLLLGMMESCGICFRMREGDKQAGIEPDYVAPDLLPDRGDIQAELDARWVREGPIAQAVYTYDLLLPALIRSLIARVGALAGLSALYWRDGLCVYEAGTQAHALIEQELDAGWSGQIIVSARGVRARELLDCLRDWIEEAQSRIGLKPRESPDRRDGANAARAAEEQAEAPAPRFASEPQPGPCWYVSYAWNDVSNPNLEREVDRLCVEAEAKGTPILRDKTAMSIGESISRFMKEIGQSGRVFVFLSAKYLKSPYCMFELFEIWRNSRLDPAEFKSRVRLFALPDAKIFSPKERLVWTKYWQTQHDDLAPDARFLGESDFRSFRLMQDFAHNVGDILTLFADTLQPRTRGLPCPWLRREPAGRVTPRTGL